MANKKNKKNIKTIQNFKPQSQPTFIGAKEIIARAEDLLDEVRRNVEQQLQDKYEINGGYGTVQGIKGNLEMARDMRDSKAVLLNTEGYDPVKILQAEVENEWAQFESVYPALKKSSEEYIQAYNDYQETHTILQSLPAKSYDADFEGYHAVDITGLGKYTVEVEDRIEYYNQQSRFLNREAQKLSQEIKSKESNFVRDPRQRVQMERKIVKLGKRVRSPYNLNASAPILRYKQNEGKVTYRAVFTPRNQSKLKSGEYARGLITSRDVADLCKKVKTDTSKIIENNNVFLDTETGAFERNGKLISMPVQLGAGRRVSSGKKGFEGKEHYADYGSKEKNIDWILDAANRWVDQENEEFMGEASQHFREMFGMSSEQAKLAKNKLTKEQVEAKYDEVIAKKLITPEKYLAYLEAEMVEARKRDANAVMEGQNVNYDENALFNWAEEVYGKGSDKTVEFKRRLEVLYKGKDETRERILKSFGKHGDALRYSKGAAKFQDILAGLMGTHNEKAHTALADSADEHWWSERASSTNLYEQAFEQAEKIAKRGGVAVYDNKGYATEEFNALLVELIGRYGNAVNNLPQKTGMPTATKEQVLEEKEIRAGVRNQLKGVAKALTPEQRKSYQGRQLVFRLNELGIQNAGVGVDEASVYNIALDEIIKSLQKMGKGAVVEVEKGTGIISVKAFNLSDYTAEELETGNYDTSKMFNIELPLPNAGGGIKVGGSVKESEIKPMLRGNRVVYSETGADIWGVGSRLLKSDYINEVLTKEYDSEEERLEAWKRAEDWLRKTSRGSLAKARPRASEKKKDDLNWVSGLEDTLQGRAKRGIATNAGFLSNFAYDYENEINELLSKDAESKGWSYYTPVNIYEPDDYFAQVFDQIFDAVANNTLDSVIKEGDSFASHLARDEAFQSFWDRIREWANSLPEGGVALSSVGSNKALSGRFSLRSTIGGINPISMLSDEEFEQYYKVLAATKSRKYGAQKPIIRGKEKFDKPRSELNEHMGMYITQEELDNAVKALEQAGIIIPEIIKSISLEDAILSGNLFSKFKGPTISVDAEDATDFSPDFLTAVGVNEEYLRSMKEGDYIDLRGKDIASITSDFSVNTDEDILASGGSLYKQIPVLLQKTASGFVTKVAQEGRMYTGLKGSDMAGRRAHFEDLRGKESSTGLSYFDLLRNEILKSRGITPDQAYSNVRFMVRAPKSKDETDPRKAGMLLQERLKGIVNAAALTKSIPEILQAFKDTGSILGKFFTLATDENGDDYLTTEYEMTEKGLARYDSNRKNWETLFSEDENKRAEQYKSLYGEDLPKIGQLLLGNYDSNLISEAVNPMGEYYYFGMQGAGAPDTTEQGKWVRMEPRAVEFWKEQLKNSRELLIKRDMAQAESEGKPKTREESERFVDAYLEQKMADYDRVGVRRAEIQEQFDQIRRSIANIDKQNVESDDRKRIYFVNKDKGDQLAANEINLRDLNLELDVDKEKGNTMSVESYEKTLAAAAKRKQEELGAGYEDARWILRTGLNPLANQPDEVEIAQVDASVMDSDVFGKRIAPSVTDMAYIDLLRAVSEGDEDVILKALKYTREKLVPIGRDTSEMGKKALGAALQSAGTAKVTGANEAYTKGNESTVWMGERDISQGFMAGSGATREDRMAAIQNIANTIRYLADAVGDTNFSANAKAWSELTDFSGLNKISDQKLMVDEQFMMDELLKKIEDTGLGVPIEFLRNPTVISGAVQTGKAKLMKGLPQGVFRMNAAAQALAKMDFDGDTALARFLAAIRTGKDGEVVAVPYSLYKRFLQLDEWRAEIQAATNIQATENLGRGKAPEIPRSEAMEKMAKYFASEQKRKTIANLSKFNFANVGAASAANTQARRMFDIVMPSIDEDKSLLQLLGSIIHGANVSATEQESISAKKLIDQMMSGEKVTSGTEIIEMINQIRNRDLSLYDKDFFNADEVKKLMGFYQVQKPEIYKEILEKGWWDADNATFTDKGVDAVRGVAGKLYRVAGTLMARQQYNKLWKQPSHHSDGSIPTGERPVPKKEQNETEQTYNTDSVEGKISIGSGGNIVINSSGTVVVNANGKAQINGTVQGATTEATKPASKPFAVDKDGKPLYKMTDASGRYRATMAIDASAILAPAGDEHEPTIIIDGQKYKASDVRTVTGWTKNYSEPSTSQADEMRLETAARKGTYVHSYMEAMVKSGVKTIEELTPEIRAQIDAQIAKGYNQGGLGLSPTGDETAKLRNYAEMLMSAALATGDVNATSMSEITRAGIVGQQPFSGTYDIGTWEKDENGNFTKFIIADWKNSTVGGINDPKVGGERFIQTASYARMEYDTLSQAYDKLMETGQAFTGETAKKLGLEATEVNAQLDELRQKTSVISRGDVEGINYRVAEYAGEVIVEIIKNLITTENIDKAYELQAKLQAGEAVDIEKFGRDRVIKGFYTSEGYTTTAPANYQEWLNKQEAKKQGASYTTQEQAIKKYLTQYKQVLNLQAQIDANEKRLTGKTGESAENGKAVIAAQKRQLALLQAEMPQLNLEEGTLNGEPIKNQETLLNLKKQIAKLEGEQAIKLEKNNSLAKQHVSFIQQIADGFKASFRNLTDYSMAYAVIGKIRMAYSQLIQYAEQLNASMVNLQIASGLSYSTIKDMMLDFNELASEVGKSTVEVAEAANDWLRAGYEGSEATELTNASMHLSTLGMIESSQATSYLISVLKGWKIEASEVMEVVDKLTVTICSVCRVIGIGHKLKSR